MSLTEFEIKQFKPKDKRYFESDGRGLIMEIKPNGSKFWIVRSYFEGKEKRKYIGAYPEVTLKMAREAATVIKKELKSGKKNEENIKFAEIAEEWVETKVKPTLSSGYVEKTKLRIEKHIKPMLGNKIISEINAAMILDLCRSIEAKGTIYTAHRIKQIIGQIMRYAIATQRAEQDPTPALTGALKLVKEKHYAALTDAKDIAVLMANIREYPRQVTRIALQFSAITFCRPGEVRKAEWAEINLEKKEWRIPWDKMKMKKEHIVPLTTQAIELIEELRPLTEKWGRWLFPSERLDGRPMSDNTIRIALRTMGYGEDEMTAHGFRGMASTILHENGFPHEAVEIQLAHAQTNQVAAAYNHAKYMPVRRQMMQWYSDLLMKE